MTREIVTFASDHPGASLVDVLENGDWVINLLVQPSLLRGKGYRDLILRVGNFHWGLLKMKRRQGAGQGSQQPYQLTLRKIGRAANF